MDTSLKQEARRVNAFDRLRFSVLCRRDVPATTAKEVIGWWESRRIPFNFIVGTAGILTCIIVGMVGLGSSILFGSDFGMPDPPLFALFGVLIYGIIANVFYTGGWLSELAIRRLWPHEADRFAMLTISTGLVFSVVLTLAPGILVAAGAVYELAVRFRAPHP